VLSGSFFVCRFHFDSQKVGKLCFFSISKTQKIQFCAQISAFLRAIKVRPYINQHIIQPFFFTGNSLLKPEGELSFVFLSCLREKGGTRRENVSDFVEVHFDSRAKIELDFLISRFSFVRTHGKNFIVRPPPSIFGALKTYKHHRIVTCKFRLSLVDI
jgi:hypothetical protein